MWNIFENVRNSSSSISETIVLRSVPTRSASTATCFDRSEETRRGRKKRSRSQYIHQDCKLLSPVVSFGPCQQNLIKTFQNEADTTLITKIALNIFGRNYETHKIAILTFKVIFLCQKLFKSLYFFIREHQWRFLKASFLKITYF